MQHEHPAVVLCLSANGIGVVRSLRRKGISVYAYDIKERYQLGRTRHAVCGICPHPTYNQEELLTFLIRLGESLGKKAVLYAASDDFVYFISKFRESLSGLYSFLLPDHTLIEAVLDKRLTYELARKHNIPCPKTYIINHEDQLESLSNELTFPCILKPVFSDDYRKRLNKKAIIIEKAETLQQEYRIYRQYGELLIQELIPGNEDQLYGVGAFFDEKMNLIGLFTSKKLQQFPPYFGSASLMLSTREETSTELGIAFLEELQFKGFGKLEFKKDPRDGVMKFLEINARTWLSHSLSTACGVNICYLYYLSMTGQDPQPITNQKEGIKWVYLVRDFLSFRQKEKNGEMTFWEWIKNLSGKREYALFTWDDPMPFFRITFNHLYNAWKSRREQRKRTGKR
ncbi:carboxylate--amine ligase [Paenibacillus spongiae]|uniref:Carbamoyl-phosphate synthase n=1 Tax=Paenibacillus spongiae TaxID=2909671 RepID=A0ABY5SBL7_9BACL|nr:carbamoyl-phosphate synthase [Paenibacillus spongiae]UVI29683.1 carbamoyl-phosphate synthase [Paenibacillus spongiae]